MLRVLPPTFKPVLQQIRSLQAWKVAAESREYVVLLFFKQNLPNENLFCSKRRISCVWSDSRVILSNRKQEPITAPVGSQ